MLFIKIFPPAWTLVNEFLHNWKTFLVCWIGNATGISHQSSQCYRLISPHLSVYGYSVVCEASAHVLFMAAELSILAWINSGEELSVTGVSSQGASVTGSETLETLMEPSVIISVSRLLLHYTYLVGNSWNFSMLCKIRSIEEEKNVKFLEEKCYNMVI